MSSQAATGQPAGARGRWVKVALVLSLVLNVCFVAGPFLWHEFAPTPAQRFQHGVIRQLDLNPDQRRAFEDFIRTVRQSWRLLRDKNEPLAQQVWSEAAKATPDQADIEQLMAQADDNRRQFQQTAAKALTAFMAALTPPQRATFADLVKNHQDRMSERLRHTLIP